MSDARTSRNGPGSGPGKDDLSPLKRALLAVERLQDRVRDLEGERRRPLAVIGMGCRFPAGGDPEAYWEALRRGEDAVRDRPPVARPGLPGPDFPPAGYLPDDISAFDPGFFGISPREAASIDPQQRLLLEVAWEALEHAGIDPHGLEGSRTGVFVGLAGNDYAQMQLSSERAAELLTPHFASGIGHSMASGRISWLLGLQGPAITVDTACSSSLVATHLACQSLRSGESDLALAAGTNLILSGDFTMAFQQSRMLAADGRCRTFDAAAGGFGRGEGCGVVVLRRLEDAQRDGDRILAVVRGTAVNQDGPSSGLTAPSGPAQEAVIREALQQAGLTSDDIGYLEAHGTGTSLGDPIEVQALGAVFGKRDEPLVVGSVKTNMGHLEAAAGIAGLIKVVQSLRQGEIPPHLHFREPSPHIPWDDYSLKVPTTATPFARTGGRRRGAVSSFGFSGTNAHVILEEAPNLESMGEVSGADPDGDAAKDASGHTARTVHLLPISAPEEAGLRESAGRYARHLEASEDAFADLCHLGGAGRAHFARRLAVVAPDARSAASALDRWSAGEEAPDVQVGSRTRPDPPALAFLYTGQGAQYPGMGRELYRSSPVFRREMDRCQEILGDRLEVPLLDLLDPAHPQADLIHRTDLTQPALFALQHSLTELWAAWGIRPGVVLGHSIGEFAAARVAGVFSLEDALHLVAARGRAMHAVQHAGRMLAVMATEDRVAEWVASVGGPLSLAAINAPTQMVVSGAPDAVKEVESLAAEAGVRTRELRTSHAFHSPLMDDALQGMEKALKEVELKPASRVRFVSTLTGRAAKPSELADPAYWVRQIRQPVRFGDAAAAAAALTERAVEIGPHPALTGLVGQSDTELPISPSLHRERGTWPTLMGSLAELYVEGVDPDWRGLAEGHKRRRVELPSSPFQRSHLWVDTGSGRREDGAGMHPLVGSERPRPGGSREFQRTVREDAPAFIGEHRVLGRVLLPGTGFIEMALTAASRVLGGEVTLEGLDFVAPMIFDEGPRRVHVSVTPEGPASARVEIHSVDARGGPEAAWTLHASGVAERNRDSAAAADSDLESIRARCPDPVDVEGLYRSMAERGFALGPRLHTLTEVRVGRDECLTRVRLPEACAEDPGGYRVHPLLLDAALQSVGPALGDDSERSYLPMGVGRVLIQGELGSEACVHVRITDRGERTMGADLRLMDDRGRELVTLEGIRFREVHADDLARRVRDPFLRIRWVPEEGDASPPPTADPKARAQLVARTEEALRREAEREGAAEYDAFVERLEARAGGWVGHAFRTLGWTPEPGATVELRALAGHLEVVPSRRRLLARCLDILAEEGALERVGEGWRVIHPLEGKSPAPDPEAVAAERDSGGAGAPPELILLERCGPHLADALRGRGDPLELLFPGGDSSVAERMYHDTPLARIFHRSVAEAVEAVVEQLPAGRPLRILEVGAGTGGTTRGVIDRLLASESDAAREVEYTFTDVSGLFVERARRRFEEVPGMRFHTFDLDRAPEDQGLELAGFDLVLAANCLHAARDLAGATGAVGRLLRPGGLLVAVEVFAPHRWFDLTVGLTDGWWHFTDDELRGRYPCISPEAWRGVLENTGFDEVHPVVLADQAGTDGIASSGQGMVLARRTAPQLTGLWLVLGDATGQAGAVARQLEAAGVETVLRSTNGPDDEPDTEGDGGAQGEAAATVVEKLVGDRDGWAGILHCAGAGDDRSLEPGAIQARLRRGAGSLLGAARAVVGGGTRVDQLCVITRGGQLVDEHDAELDPAAAALWGLMRSARLEAPGLPARCLDLDPSHSDDQAGRVLGWLSQASPEPELALRRGTLLAPRLVEGGNGAGGVGGRSGIRDASGISGTGSAEAPAGDGRHALPAEYRLAPPSGGSLDDLRFTEGERTPPGPGQVEIRVVASGLNFKDVLNVLGMYPGDPGPLGSECSGVVTRVGQGVELVPGTPVVAAAGHAYGRHVLADATLVAPRPTGLSFVEGATLPVACLTAHFALNHLGKLGPDDRVLIHAAAGGVGSAACALAARVGAEIFATAGTEEKREQLRARGIRHVFDSRSDAFVDGVREATDGAGVTVVLNSLADDLVDRTFDVVAKGGRLLEIGKRGIWSPEQVRELDRDIEYHIIDWGQTHIEDPELVGGLFREVMALVGDGGLRPLPVTVFPLRDASAAFRYMANALQIGKIVLTHPVLTSGQDAPDVSRAITEGTCLVTGGTAGLGLETVRWLVDQGATSVVAAARSEPSAEAQAVLDGLAGNGVEIHVRRCDVGDLASVQKLVDWIRDALSPLQVIVHSAGTLADRTLPRATWQDFESVLRTKAEGSLNLVTATRSAPPAIFLGYSSIAGVLGSPGQANHATANAFLDAFAATRWRDGAAGSSIAWGPWSETGSATADETLARTRELGIEALTTRQGIACLDHFIRNPEPHLVAMRLTDPAALARGRSGHLLKVLVDGVSAGEPQAEGASTGKAAGSTDAVGLPALLAATPPDARRSVLMNRVRRRVRSVLGLSAEAPVDPDRPLGELGLDSLLAVELKNVLGNEVEARLPATLLFDYPTLAALTGHLLILLSPEHDTTPSGGPVTEDSAPGGERGPDPLGSVESLSDDEVDRLLSEQFESND